MPKKNSSFGELSKKYIIAIGGGVSILFIISIAIIIIIIKKNMKSPTSVKKIINYNTQVITPDLITGGWGSANYEGDKIIYVVGNNGGGGDNPNTAVYIIKYPVTTGSVYQVSITLNTVTDNNLIKITGNTYLPQWDGNFVLDDLKTPANSNYITIPTNSIINYTYNTKWWRPSGDYFTIVFKFASKTDTMVIGNLTITPLP
jgi:hypothetical protein